MVFSVTNVVAQMNKKKRKFSKSECQFYNICYFLHLFLVVEDLVDTHTFLAWKYFYSMDDSNGCGTLYIFHLIISQI